MSGAADGQAFLGGMDISVQRNYFGSQVASAVTAMDLAPDFLAELARDDLPGALEKEGAPCGVFIRAPAIVTVGSRATALAWVSLPCSGGPTDIRPSPVCVAARERSFLATAFHPELTPQRAFHRLFVRMVEAAGAAPAAEVLASDSRKASCPGAPGLTPADVTLPMAPLLSSTMVFPLTAGTSASSSYRR